MVTPSAEYRRREIIDATLKAINTVGLSKISYDLIAEEAGTSRQLIRHYYPEIETLMVDIVSTVMREYREATSAETQSSNSTTGLEMVLDFFFNQLPGRLLQSNNSFDAMFTLANNSSEIKQAMHAAHEELLTMFETELRLAHPALQEHAYSELGHLFNSVVTGHWRMVATLGMSDTYTLVARRAMDRLIESYSEDLQSTEGGSNG